MRNQFLIGRLKNLFSIGTLSLMFGVHQFLLHFLLVLRAWIVLFGWPNWRELVCIFVHDIGYKGCKDMDGEEGKKHPETGARIAARWFGDEYRDLVLYHSRFYAELHGVEPSKLCWADKLSMLYDPVPFYLWRARLTGELEEWRERTKHKYPLELSDEEWLKKIKQENIYSMPMELVMKIPESLLWGIETCGG